MVGMDAWCTICNQPEEGCSCGVAPTNCGPGAKTDIWNENNVIQGLRVNIAHRYSCVVVCEQKSSTWGLVNVAPGHMYYVGDKAGLIAYMNQEGCIPDPWYVPAGLKRGEIIDAKHEPIR